MARLRNEFAWSQSREDTFRRCPRQYFYAYYGSWGGWEATADERTRRLYVLKQLKTRQMWAGERVHTCIEHTLKNLRRGIDVLEPKRIIEVTLAEMRNDFRSSRAGTYWRSPKSCALFEHEYRVPVPPEAWRQTAADVEQCLRTFYSSELFGQLRALPREAWLEIEELGQFVLGDVKVWTKVDCCYRSGDGVRIVDWKTGRSLARKNTNQLVCYSLYAHEKWGPPVEQIRPAEYYLLVDRLQDYTVSAGDVEDVRAFIQGSVEDMRSLLADVEGNQPLAESAFEKTEKSGVCRRCKFVGLCRAELLPVLRGEAGA
ncbi:MAG: PD-(D/E)XK nuclease family protein [Candidatus Brocadiia bacterium]